MTLKGSFLYALLVCAQNNCAQIRSWDLFQELTKANFCGRPKELTQSNFILIWNVRDPDPKMCRFCAAIAQSIPMPYYLIVRKAQGQIDLVNRVPHLLGFRAAGQNTCITTSATLLIELVFDFQNRTGVRIP